MTSGLQPNEMVLVAGRPAMGKSAYALNIVEHACIKNNIPTAIFTLEMGKDQIVNRLISEYAMIEGSKMKDGSFSEVDFEKALKAASVIKKAPLFIDDTPGISVSELRAKCRRLKLEHQIGLVVIDYLQLMEASSGKNHSRQEEVSEISRNIKAIARELKAPVIALSQLSRTCEQRPDKRPMLSDLRESGAIEQDADIVMFLYRDEYYNPDSEHKGEGEIIIAKNRSGSTGTVRVGFLKDFTKYVNPENNYTNEMFNRANKEKEEQKQMQGESVISTNEMNAYDDIPINDMEG
ncbi:MAG: DnaB-like helicase C-terminal domain-containing protein [Clostridia bacterium]|nr:DnaB-like helicase C-terminal domain-containing protein [Clostridia bacterium]